MKIKTLIAFIVCIFITSAIQAQNDINETKRPKIGLVLSGGGAKGLAHIGAIRAIEKAGIKIDMVCGTSMGSIVGALYATGYTPDQIEKMLCNLDWDQLLSDWLDHRRMDDFERKTDGKYYIKTERGKARSGLTEGRLIMILLSKLFVPVHGITDFSKFKRSFACVATNLETGEPVVIKDGYIAEAVRASMSYPMVFRPAERDGMLLVDGGIVSNLPAKELKSLGADIIIGVNVGSPLSKRRELRTIPQILAQCVSYLNEKDMESQKQTCDVLIEPDIKTFSTFSFTNLPTIIKSGETACKAHEEELKEIAKLNDTETSAETTLPDYNENQKIKFNSIEIVGAEKTDTDYLYNRIGDLKKRELSLKDISKISERMLGTGLIGKSYFKILNENDKNKLVFIVETTKSLERNIGLRYEEGQGAQLLINHTIKNKYFPGSKTNIDTVLSDRPRLTISEQLYEVANTGFGSEIELDMRRKKVDSLYNNMQINFKDEVTTLAFSLHKRFSSSFIIKGGVMKRFADTNLSVISDDINSKDYEFTGYFGQITTDNLSSTLLPRFGNKFNFTYIQANDKALFRKKDTTDDFKKYTANYKGYIPVSNKTTLGILASWGKITSERIPGGELFHLGGKNIYDDSSIPLYGLKYQSLSGKNVITTGFEIRRNVGRDKNFFIRGNKGKITNKESTLFSSKDQIEGGEIAYAIGDKFGQIEISYGTNNYDHDKRMLISFGNAF